MVILELYDEETLDGFLSYEDEEKELYIHVDIRGGKLYYGDDEITFKQFLELSINGD